jgi:polygalacturonase
LDLTKLKQGSTVTFAGKTTFQYYDWDGDLIKISGKGITITAASGAVIDGKGQAWWDGQGSNGGVKK